MNQFKVSIDDLQEKVNVPKGIRMLVRRCCKAVLFVENREDFECVNIVFTDDHALSELSGNNLARGRQEIFVRNPIGIDSKNNLLLGEIFISLESAMYWSKFYNNSIEAEITFLTAHAMLLLLGNKNSTSFEKDAFLFKENIILQNLGITYQSHDL